MEFFMGTNDISAKDATVSVLIVDKRWVLISLGYDATRLCVLNCKRCRSNKAEESKKRSSYIIASSIGHSHSTRTFFREAERANRGKRSATTTSVTTFSSRKFTRSLYIFAPRKQTTTTLCPLLDSTTSDIIRFPLSHWLMYKQVVHTDSIERESSLAFDKILNKCGLYICSWMLLRQSVFLFFFGSFDDESVRLIKFFWIIK